MTNMAITRRGFMKAAATATAALGVAGAPVLLDEVDQAFADSIPKREKHKTAMPWLYQLLPRLRVHRGRCGGED
ncbi:MAG: twin-arginine translocation signal domain-containing protein [Adlercreutzia equolifaciens]